MKFLHNNTWVIVAYISKFQLIAHYGLRVMILCFSHRLHRIVLKVGHVKSVLQFNIIVESLLYDSDYFTAYELAGLFSFWLQPFASSKVKDMKPWRQSCFSLYQERKLFDFKATADGAGSYPSTGAIQCHVVIIDLWITSGLKTLLIVFWKLSLDSNSVLWTSQNL